MSNFTKCHSMRPATMKFLHPSSRGRTLVRGFGSQLLPLCFTTSWFVGHLLCMSHGIETSLLTPHLPQLELCELEEVLALESSGGCEHTYCLYYYSGPTFSPFTRFHPSHPNFQNQSLHHCSHPWILCICSLTDPFTFQSVPTSPFLSYSCQSVP